MSSSPASLDADVNSLSTTSSTASSSCPPLVPNGRGGGCGGGKHASGPGSIITYIDCNSASHLLRHAPFLSPLDQGLDGDDDEGDEADVEVTQIELKVEASSAAPCLQVRRGSEPVLTTLHRSSSDDDVSDKKDNSKRWSTAIAVDSSSRRGCGTQTKRSSESLVSVNSDAMTSAPSISFRLLYCLISAASQPDMRSLFRRNMPIPAVAPVAPVALLVTAACLSLSLDVCVPVAPPPLARLVSRVPLSSRV